jgi:twitching motility protein PilT
MGLSLSDLLKRMLEMNGSDLHITTNSPPQIRVHGHLVPLDLPQMTPAETKQLAYSVMTDSQKHRFEESLELDFSFGLKGLARFRANCFNQRGATAAVFRLIPFEIKSFNQLGLAPVVSKLCDKPRGLVLVTGPTGSGKSTTLASMIDKINSERHDHILTIEDPIEFVHMNKNCLVNQRELHADTKSFTDALRAALAGPRRHHVPKPAADHQRQRPLHDHGNSDTEPRSPQPDSRRQDSPDLFVDAIGAGEIRNADV